MRDGKPAQGSLHEGVWSPKMDVPTLLAEGLTVGKVLSCMQGESHVKAPFTISHQAIQRYRLSACTAPALHCKLRS